MTDAIDTLRFLLGDPMPVFASLLRSVIVPSKGTVLNVADYAAIEARVLFWVAKHADGIKAFADGRPIYEEMAQDIYGVESVADVTPAQRFFGKTAILGAGFGLGHVKFQDSCKKFGQTITEEFAYKVIQAYRRKHAPVPTLWSNIEKAAIAAVESGGKRISVNYTTWYVHKDFLWCELPSGRQLAYSDPSVRYVTPKWGGDKRPTLFHMGVNPRTKKWDEQKTWGGVLVENVVQAISRDIMVETMLRIEGSGPWQIVLSVHDEVVAERDKRKGGTIEEFIKIMEIVPDWAKGCPIKVEGWEGERYRK